MTNLLKNITCEQAQLARLFAETLPTKSRGINQMRDDRILNAVDAFCKSTGQSYDPYTFEEKPFEFGPEWDKIGRHYLNAPLMDEETRFMSYLAFKEVIFHQAIDLIRVWGFVPILCDSDPYADFNQLKAEFNGCHLKVRSTRSIDGSRDDLPNKSHPMNEQSAITDDRGRRLSYNDLFRFVHDIYTHLAHDLQFDFSGEINAVMAHAHTMQHRPESIHALLNETLFQTCGFVSNGGEFAEQRIVETSVYNSVLG